MKANTTPDPLQGSSPECGEPDFCLRLSTNESDFTLDKSCKEQQREDVTDTRLVNSETDTKAVIRFNQLAKILLLAADSSFDSIAPSDSFTYSPIEEASTDIRMSSPHRTEATRRVEEEEALDEMLAQLEQQREDEELERQLEQEQLIEYQPEPYTMPQTGDYPIAAAAEPSTRQLPETTPLEVNEGINRSGRLTQAAIDEADAFRRRHPELAPRPAQLPSNPFTRDNPFSREVTRQLSTGSLYSVTAPPPAQDDPFSRDVPLQLPTPSPFNVTVPPATQANPFSRDGSSQWPTGSPFNVDVPRTNPFSRGLDPSELPRVYPRPPTIGTEQTRRGAGRRQRSDLRHNRLRVDRQPRSFLASPATAAPSSQEQQQQQQPPPPPQPQLGLQQQEQEQQPPSDQPFLLQQQEQQHHQRTHQHQPRRPEPFQRRAFPAGPFVYPLRSPSTQRFTAPPAPAPNTAASSTFTPIFHNIGDMPTKRKRRRGEEIDKIYVCGWHGCQKAYGAIHHLNNHVKTEGHGEKRISTEFAEARKAWKEREAARELARELARKADTSTQKSTEKGRRQDDDDNNEDADGEDDLGEG